MGDENLSVSQSIKGGNSSNTRNTKQKLFPFDFENLVSSIINAIKKVNVFIMKN